LLRCCGEAAALPQQTTEMRMGVVHRQTAPVDGATWDYATVGVKAYHEGGASAGATRRILVGQDEGNTDFIIRYFTLPPGGRSAYDRHSHQHGVVVVQGYGQVLLGETWTPIGIGDAIFIAPDEVHQLHADEGGPLGFLCVIPAWAKAQTATVGTPAASEVTR
jgi:quercetin dioxygenase-like cupin family protein